MRLLCGIALVLTLAGSLMFAEENPAGNWKLNARLSHLEGFTPEFVHDGIMEFRPPVFRGTSQPLARVEKKTDRPDLYVVELSPDGQRLTLTEPATRPGFKAIFDKL